MSTPTATPAMKRTLKQLRMDLNLPKGANTTPMETPTERTTKDTFAMVVFLIVSPYTLVLYLAVTAYLLLPKIPMWLYARSLASHGKQDAYVPPTVGFYAMASIETILVLPVVVLALVHAFVVQLLAFVIFAPVGLVTGVNFRENLAVIQGVGEGRGQRDGFFSYWVASPRRAFELWRCLCGMYHRQGFAEWILAISFMVVLNPFFKYWFTTNLWLWDLESVWCNQWTENYPPEFSRKEVSDAFVQIATHAFPHDKDLIRKIDTACFCPYYALPPPGYHTNECLGMQYTPRRFSALLVLTKHWHMCRERHNPLSDTGVDAVCEVNLHYSNPWHVLTGYVEVNVMDEGEGNRIEHPMWIVMPRNGYLGGKFYLSVNGVFGKFAPELRDSIIGLMEASRVEQ